MLAGLRFSANNSISQKTHFFFLKVGGTNGMIISFICRKLKTKASAYNKAVKIKVWFNLINLIPNLPPKASLVAICIILTFLITWLPNQVTSLIMYIQAINSVPTTNLVKNIHRLTTCLLFISSSINPFLYAFYGQRLRKTIINRVIMITHREPVKRTQKVPYTVSTHSESRSTQGTLFQTNSSTEKNLSSLKVTLSIWLVSNLTK